MYAVVRTGNKQFRVEPGVQLLVDRLEGVEAGKPIVLEDVLLVSDGTKLDIGKPNVGAKVHCTCIGEELGKKLVTVKYKRRKNYRRRYGHRQQLVRLQVDRIDMN